MKTSFKRNPIQIILIVLLLIAGILILLYPTISNAWNEMRDRRLNSSYLTSVSRRDGSELRQMRKDAQEYNSTLIGSTVPDAFSQRDDVSDPVYESLLDPNGNGVMGIIEIPIINVELPIYHYTTRDSLEKGAAHLPGSSLPVGGESTHCVISAHRGLPSQLLFTDLDRLEEGDLFYLHVLDETLAYCVDQIKVVDPTDTGDLAITEGEDYCTLVTCTPYGINTQRLLVRGHRVPYSEETYNEENNTTAGPSTAAVAARVICVLIGLGLAVVGIIIYSKLTDRKHKQIEE